MDFHLKYLDIPFSREELELISVIHWQSAKEAYAYRQWQSTLEDVIDWYEGKSRSWDRVLLCLLSSRQSEVVIGFAAAKNNYLDQLFVIPQYQRLGAGSKLISTIFDNFHGEKYLDVLKGNFNARYFYEKHGFKLQHSRWDDEENEFIMLYGSE